MQTQKDFNKGFYSFRADANAVGGFLEEPFRATIPTVAPVSLPAVGGFTMARPEAFTLHNIVSCSSAYSLVSGKENEDETFSIYSTAVVEGLSILGQVTAKRVVAQLLIDVSKEGKLLKVTTTGSCFEGLCIAGQRREAQLCQSLPASATEQDVWNIGRTQATTVTDAFTGRDNAKWAENRFRWMKDAAAPNVRNLCSLLDGFDAGDPECCGHVVDIPDIGRFIFGELRISPDSAQLVSIRAELGCAVKGKITINCTGGGGAGNF